LGLSGWRNRASRPRGIWLIRNSFNRITHDLLLPHIFERFWQGDSTITRRYSGLGLGLALVRH